jgi:hypothetical protein
MTKILINLSADIDAARLYREEDCERREHLSIAWPSITTARVEQEPFMTEEKGKKIHRVH